MQKRSDDSAIAIFQFLLLLTGGTAPFLYYTFWTIPLASFPPGSAQNLLRIYGEFYNSHVLVP